MNRFDSTVIHFLNSFAGRSESFDAINVFMSGNVLLEGGLIVVLFWCAWMQSARSNSRDRERLLFGLFASIFAVFVARILSLTLPFRLRPLHNPLIDFRIPYGMDQTTLIGWSSFPSDHAVVFFCLAMSIWLVSKRLGAVALLYAALGTSFPRIYLGIHYPTDMIAGAALGIGIACLANAEGFRTAMMRPILFWQEHFPGSFTAFLFLCSFEVAEEFNSIRSIALSSYHGVEMVLRAHR